VKRSHTSELNPSSGRANWVLLKAAQEFPALRDTWDLLNSRHGSHLLLDSAFVGSVVRHFARPDTLLAVSDGADAAGMVLLERIRPGCWQTFQPSQAPLGLLALSDWRTAGDQLQQLMRKLPGYTISLSVLHQDPEYSAFLPSEGSRNTQWQDYMTTARVTLNGTFDEYWANRSRKLGKDLARQRRRLLERHSHIEYVVDRDPAAVAAAIDDYGRLEIAGWKGRAGTAVTRDNVQGRFYREVLETFGARAEASIFRLLLDGQTIAMELSLERDGTMVDLKTTYDESLSGLSPFSLLEQEKLKGLFNEGKIRVLEFYGPVLEWTRRWTDEIRTMQHVTFYRNAAAHLAHKLWQRRTRWGKAHA
jgi:CelD/BcsL family acetyltransferase involved in cellulose biosynthesis